MWAKFISKTDEVTFSLGTLGTQCINLLHLSVAQTTLYVNRNKHYKNKSVIHSTRKKSNYCQINSFAFNTVCIAAIWFARTNILMYFATAEAAKFDF